MLGVLWERVMRSNVPPSPLINHFFEGRTVGFRGDTGEIFAIIIDTFKLGWSTGTIRGLANANASIKFAEIARASLSIWCYKQAYQRSMEPLTR